MIGIFFLSWQLDKYLFLIDLQWGMFSHTISLGIESVSISNWKIRRVWWIMPGIEKDENSWETRMHLRKRERGMLILKLSSVWLMSRTRWPWTTFPILRWKIVSAIVGAIVTTKIRSTCYIIISSIYCALVCTRVHATEKLNFLVRWPRS